MYPRCRRGKLRVILVGLQPRLLQQLLLESCQMGKEGEVAPPKYVRTVGVSLPTGWWSTRRMVEHAKPEKLALPALAPAPPLSKEPEPSQRGLRARLGRLRRLLPAQLAVAHRVHLSYSTSQFHTVLVAVSAELKPLAATANVPEAVRMWQTLLVSKQIDVDVL